MLTKFSVSNFQGISGKRTLDLTASDYEFNEDYVTGRNVVPVAGIYSKTDTGKTSLAYAMLDILSNITELDANYRMYRNFKNMTSDANVQFEYQFLIETSIVTYTYIKSDKTTIISEKVVIDNEVVAERSVDDVLVSIFLKEPVTLSKNVYMNKYLESRVINDSKLSRVYFKFLDFVKGMSLMSSSQTDDASVGVRCNDQDTFQTIVDRFSLSDFQTFLSRLGFERRLSKVNNMLCANYGDYTIEYKLYCTKVELLIAQIFIAIKSSANLIVIDDLGDNVDSNIGKRIIRQLLEYDVQTIFTSHNTALITNEILRPDCYFILNKDNLNSFALLANIEIKEAHNLEKLYKSGWFDN